jgi:hypothetical protein
MIKKQLLLAILFILLLNETYSQIATNKNTQTIASLSDYSFIGDGYGLLTSPSMPAPGVYEPYVPDLTNLSDLTIVNVSSSSELVDELSGGASDKVIVCEDGTYTSSITLNNIDNVYLIAKNKGGAIFETSSNTFTIPSVEANVSNFGIIGFKALGNGSSGGDGYFIFGPGTSSSYHVKNIYFSDMEWNNYGTVIYGGLHSHDWTIDKSTFTGGVYEYLWYMMGWHHSIINTVIYGSTWFPVAIRGSYPPDEDYSDYGCPQITSRSEHFLSDDDWTHLIVNNTFGTPSTIETHPYSYDALLVLYYEADEGDDTSEGVYFPPINVMVYNNAFIDNLENRIGMSVMASRGINDDNIASVSLRTVSYNYCKGGVFDADGTPTNDADISNNVGNFSDFGFNDAERDYTITSSSGLADNGTSEFYYPNVDNAGNLRDNNPDVGAFEAPGGYSGIMVDFTVNMSVCDANVSFTNTSSGSATSFLWDFGDGTT